MTDRPLLDRTRALGHRFAPVENAYDERDLAIYAHGILGVRDPLDSASLRAVYEGHAEGMIVMPTFGIVPAFNATMALLHAGARAPGLDHPLERTLHGEHRFVLDRPLPLRARLRHEVRVKEIFDKGAHAVVWTEIESFDERGRRLATNEVGTFVHGAGGFGGPRGTSVVDPSSIERAPDVVVHERTLPTQALLYRLSGDLHPMHVDPAFARTAGLERPILHGLCTLGISVRAAFEAFAIPFARMRSVAVRFAESVVPGDALTIEAVRESEYAFAFRTWIEGRGLAISHATITLFDEASAATSIA